MTDIAELLRVEEYRALRATIRERGSLRLIVSAITFPAWAAVLLAACALFTMPLFGIVPLAVLASGFEAVFALHVGVERIGRYIQVHHEATAGLDGWEHTVMRFGLTGGGIHPLMPTLFIAAALLNLAALSVYLLDASQENLAQNAAAAVPYAALHLGFIIRVVVATRYAAGQRARDLQEFDRIRRMAGRDPND